jgi:hypothetical protein
MRWEVGSVKEASEEWRELTSSAIELAIEWIPWATW